MEHRKARGHLQEASTILTDAAAGQYSVYEWAQVVFSEELH